MDEENGSDVHPQSRIAFFVNGACEEVAFSHLQAGCYYPALSLYMGGTGELNCGPDFAFPPSSGTLSALGLSAPQPIICLQPPKPEAVGGGGGGGAFVAADAAGDGNYKGIGTSAAVRGGGGGGAAAADAAAGLAAAGVVPAFDDGSALNSEMT